MVRWFIQQLVKLGLSIRLFRVDSLEKRSSRPRIPHYFLHLHVLRLWLYDFQAEPQAGAIDHQGNAQTPQERPPWNVLRRVRRWTWRHCRHRVKGVRWADCRGHSVETQTLFRQFVLYFNLIYAQDGILLHWYIRKEHYNVPNILCHTRYLYRTDCYSCYHGRGTDDHTCVYVS